jgi:hypothetical protein
MSLTIQIKMMHNHVHKNTKYSYKVCDMYIQYAMCMYVCIIMGGNYIQNVHNMMYISHNRSTQNVQCCIQSAHYTFKYAKRTTEYF